MARWMRRSVVADMVRLERHNAGGKLAGSGHMCSMGRVLLFLAYEQIRFWLYVVTPNRISRENERPRLLFGDDEITNPCEPR
jgi:hypothetical protein